jgi:hypothetical protein
VKKASDEFLDDWVDRVLTLATLLNVAWEMVLTFLDYKLVLGRNVEENFEI